MDTSRHVFSLGEDLMVLLCFFLLFVLPKGLIPNDEDHLLKQWLNILFISPGGSRVSWQCCTDQLQPDISLTYLVHHIYLVSQSNKNMHFVLHFMSTGCSSVCPLTWKVFCCSTSCISWTEPCCVKHNSSRRSLYPQTLYVFCSLLLFMPASETTTHRFTDKFAWQSWLSWSYPWSIAALPAETINIAIEKEWVELDRGDIPRVLRMNTHRRSVDRMWVKAAGRSNPVMSGMHLGPHQHCTVNNPEIKTFPPCC